MREINDFIQLCCLPTGNWIDSSFNIHRVYNRPFFRISCRSLTLKRTQRFLRKIKKLKKTNGTIRMCSSRAFQWMVMSVDFLNLKCFWAISVFRPWWQKSLSVPKGKQKKLSVYRPKGSWKLERGIFYFYFLLLFTQWKVRCAIVESRFPSQPLSTGPVMAPWGIT
jgi:hypothetical protein